MFYMRGCPGIIGSVKDEEKKSHSLDREKWDISGENNKERAGAKLIRP